MRSEPGPALRVLKFVGIGLLGLIAGVYITGALLPVAHSATVRTHIDADPFTVFERLRDVEGAAVWRSDLDTVQILSVPGDPLVWRETGTFGSVVMRLDESWPGMRLVMRIDDPAQPFGGTWTYRLDEVDGGTQLRITEDGEVYSPFFRFMSRFVFGHYSTLERYVHDLGQSFGQDVVVERIATQQSGADSPQAARARKQSHWAMRGSDRPAARSSERYAQHPV